ncbi:hypothetical protein W97_05995 [Coniosporium apollinis CBS 100218]|uniref:Uncharacterized protein n=1 Tax=Coniosporium apollinis (strain CBS 100218) TaxID=1168221 RepID=R7YY83_CONA1|nr:uncharacterized protein W97_05995 [Coniosporium apollinis CBS 100218]EON66749.1 hypothetical protein W97_05995 [Coniosporium apollinis CBS 100218]
MYTLFSSLPNRLLSHSFFIVSVSAAALKNITISVPEGTTDHGDPNLLCTPTSWTNIVSFYLGNYLAHAATVKSPPGGRTAGMIADVVGSLLFPPFMALRGVQAITSMAIWPIFGKSDLRTATRAGALCMIVRTTSWKPEAGDVVSDAMQKSTVCGDAAPAAAEDDQAALLPAESIPMRAMSDNESTSGKCNVFVYDAPWTFAVGTVLAATGRHIHASCKLPEDLPDGYGIAVVPRDATVMPQDGEEDANLISNNYSLVKACVALGQTVFAIATLYRAKGNQLTQFGYAAFGLTVAPYAVMSILNLLGSICSPEYPAMYLVESSVMREARKHGLHVHGTVGVLQEHPVAFQENQPGSWRRLPSSLIFEDGPDDRLVVHAGSDHTLTVLKPNADNEKDLTTAVSAILVPSCPPLAAKSKQFVKNAEWQPKGKWIVNTVDSTGRENKSGKYGYSMLEYSMTILVSVIPLAIVGAISRFDPGASTTAQRAWTMTWLVYGVFLGLLYELVVSAVTDNIDEKEYDPTMNLVVTVGFALLFSAPAIGGLVVVGQMLMAYGNCILID